MVCVFCIAVFMTLGGQVTAAVIDEISSRLQERAKDGVRKVSDTDSVAKFELEVEAAGKDVPVAVTIFKEAERVRIQLLDHDISRAEAEKLQNLLADLLDVRIIERSDPESEAKVRHAHDAPTRRAAATASAEPERQRRRWPFGRR